MNKNKLIKNENENEIKQLKEKMEIYRGFERESITWVQSYIERLHELTLWIKKDPKFTRAYMESITHCETMKKKHLSKAQKYNAIVEQIKKQIKVLE